MPSWSIQASILPPEVETGSFLTLTGPATAIAICKTYLTAIGWGRRTPSKCELRKQPACLCQWENRKSDPPLFVSMRIPPQHTGHRFRIVWSVRSTEETETNAQSVAPGGLISQKRPFGFEFELEFGIHYFGCVLPAKLIRGEILEKQPGAFRSVHVRRIPSTDTKKAPPADRKSSCCHDLSQDNPSPILTIGKRSTSLDTAVE
jgi:hypothetical protein